MDLLAYLVMMLPVVLVSGFVVAMVLGLLSTRKTIPTPSRGDEILELFRQAVELQQRSVELLEEIAENQPVILESQHQTDSIMRAR